MPPGPAQSGGVVALGARVARAATGIQVEGRAVELGEDVSVERVDLGLKRPAVSSNVWHGPSFLVSSFSMQPFSGSAPPSNLSMHFWSFAGSGGRPVFAALVWTPRMHLSFLLTHLSLPAVRLGELRHRTGIELFLDVGHEGVDLGLESCRVAEGDARAVVLGLELGKAALGRVGRAVELVLTLLELGPRRLEDPCCRPWR